jgi:non-heme chloroperoxidase
MTRRTVFVLCVLLLATVDASSQQAEWKDPSAHAIRMIAVDDGVQLEVLDWGGSGPAIVLLAGLGDTAHVYDDFAPMLTARHRVVGISRRAHGRSSAPATGYGFARLAEDVVRVIDAVGVAQPVVVGHSMAGEELHVLGARHSAKLKAVVYIDAAFNRADGSDDYDAAARKLPPAPRPGPGDLASFAALRSFLEKNQAAAGPEAHLRARYVGNADGTVAGPWMPDLPIRQALSREMPAANAPYNPEPIRLPALAMYAVPGAAADLMRPWYNADDPAVRDGVPTLFRLARERFGRHAKWFETFAARGRVSEISGPHHLFVTNPREVLQQIEGFMASLAATP